jgi:hypothetical protein
MYSIIALFEHVINTFPNLLHFLDSWDVYKKKKSIPSLLEFLIFLTRNFGKKRPILDKRQKNLLVILDKSFWTCPLWLGVYFLTKPRLAFFTSIFD